MLSIRIKIFNEMSNLEKFDHLVLVTLNKFSICDSLIFSK
jgi:hypothetical protein